MQNSNTAPIRLDAAAGGAGGSWHVLLEGLASLVREIHPEIDIKVVEGGGVGNHALVGEGRLPMAILNPPMTSAALSGTAPYDRKYPDLRVGIANLTVNHLQFVVARDVPLSSLDEWAEQRYPLRVPVDREGTVDRLVFDLAMRRMGIVESELVRWGGGFAPAANYHEQLALYRDGRVDALWQFMGVPSPSIQAAHASRPLRVLPLPDRLMSELASRGWMASHLPLGAYGAGERSIPTVAMGTSLGFHSAVPDDVVFSIVGAICDHPEHVRGIHAAASRFEPSEAPRNPGGPLHTGAERYYLAQNTL
jgi:uncharacterized protein